MTRDEFKTIIAAIKSNYRNFGIETKEQFDFWYEMLGDIEYRVMQIAIGKLVSELKFAPTIADIREQVAAIKTPQENRITAADAWGEVEQAIRKYGYYQQTEALDSMSPITRRTVDCIGFRQICLCEEPGVVRGQFLRMFDQAANKEKQNALLPENLKKQIDAIAARQNLKLVEGGSK